MEHYHIATRVNGNPHMTLLKIELAVTRNEPIDFDIYGYRARYVPERTCRNASGNDGLFECSECAYGYPDLQDFKRCQECGAKVVSE